MDDADAKQLRINYAGGSLTMPIGNLKAIFGPNYDAIISLSGDINTAVSSHSRTRVIGEPSSTVSGHTRSYKSWPTSQANNAAAGKKVLLAWEGSNGNWVGRVTGAMADFAVFLDANTSSVVTFRTSRGTKYGPFQGIIQA